MKQSYIVGCINTEDYDPIGSATELLPDSAEAPQLQGVCETEVR